MMSYLNCYLRVFNDSLNNLLELTCSCILPKINAIVQEFCKEREIAFHENAENTKLICNFKENVPEKKEINVPHNVKNKIFNDLD